MRRYRSDSLEASRSIILDYRATLSIRFRVQNSISRIQIPDQIYYFLYILIINIQEGRSGDAWLQPRPLDLWVLALAGTGGPCHCSGEDMFLFLLSRPCILVVHTTPRLQLQVLVSSVLACFFEPGLCSFLKSSSIKISIKGSVHSSRVSLHRTRSREAYLSQRRYAKGSQGLCSSAGKSHLAAEQGSDLCTNRPGQLSLSRANQCEEAPHGTAGGQCESAGPSLQACWSASRKKRSAFATFLREEHRSGATKRGKAAWVPG